MTKSFIYYHNNKEYEVKVTKERRRTITYRYKDGGFVVKATYLTTQKMIKDGLDKYFDRLTQENPHFTGFTNEYVYLLGHKIPLEEEGKINFTDGSSIIYESHEELEKKLRKWFLNYITIRHCHYEKVMGTYENRVKVRKMTSRYGSNVVSHKSITYSLILMHYQSDIIDTVIIHELAHCFEANHGPNFYKIIRKYCPNYKELQKYLKKGVYHHD